METVNVPICIVGTGDFGRALAKRLRLNGYDVIIGSRRPDSRDLSSVDKALSDVPVTSIGQALQGAQIVFLAIHSSNQSFLRQYTALLSGKIVVDVSNPTNRDSKAPSQAEELARLLPKARLVKAFNTVSAHAIENELEEQHTVFVCSDDWDARAQVVQVAARLGFHAVDSGGLQNARWMEEVNQRFCPGWGLPSLVTFIVFLIITAYSLVRYYVLRSSPYTWERLPSNVFNKIFGVTAINLLALVYMPGCFAGIIQLINGTKHKRFSKALDNWLKMRKQLGLNALLFACMHMCLSAILHNPAYFSSWYLSPTKTIPLNRTADTAISIGSRLNWKGETVVILGLLALMTMAVLGVTSIPGVAKRLNWKEWMCVHTYLGFLCLLLCTAHVMVKAVPDWPKEPFSATVLRLTFLGLLLAWLTIALKLILLIPCVHNRLWKIRRGWERGHGDDGASVDGAALTLPPEEAPMAISIPNGETNRAYQATEF